MTKKSRSAFTVLEPVINSSTPSASNIGAPEHDAIAQANHPWNFMKLASLSLEVTRPFAPQ